MNPLTFLRYFIKGLVRDNEPKQIAFALSFGIFIGLIPKNNILVHILFIFFLCFKINIPFFILSIVFFSFFSPLIDPVSDRIGYFILTLKSLNGFFTELYNMPVIPWTGFNNTVVMGGIILSIILFLPFYFLSLKLVSYYNVKFKNRVVNSRIVKALKMSFLFEWYFKND